MFFLGRNFVSSLICTRKSKKPLKPKKFPKNQGFFQHFHCIFFISSSTSFYGAFAGKLNFRGYLILQFYPTRENAHKNMCFTVYQDRFLFNDIVAIMLQHVYKNIYILSSIQFFYADCRHAFTANKHSCSVKCLLEGPSTNVSHSVK